MAGPLTGLRVIELAGIGPAPYGAMLLADLGAEVLRIDRTPARSASGRPSFELLNRGRRSVAVDLKQREGVETVLTLIERADVLLEGFRPGVTERLGLGPDVCLARNPRLIYGRMTGFGQDGPLANAAGHDINYISLAGALEPIGRAGQAPVPPLNLVGDFGGGGMLLAFGVLAALFERQTSGKGQVVDAAMVDGAASLTTLIHGLRHVGLWRDERGTNLLDGGAPFYDVYETADGKYVSIGSLEPQFYAELIERLELPAAELGPQMDRSRWPELRRLLREKFLTRTRAEWCTLLEGTDICFAPVLGMGEAAEHPHNVARGTFVELGGVRQPGPVPRFARTPAKLERPPAHAGEHTDAALADWGFAAGKIAELRERKVVG